MTCSPSVKDRFGWDFLLETRATEIDQGIPSDSRSGRLSFFVQVKTTQSTTHTWRLKLSNWEHLAKEPVPTFILLLHLDKDYEVSAAWLTHVGQSWIERTLKKLRQNSGRKLNRISMSVKVESQDQLAKPYPASIRKRLLDSLGGGFRTYCLRKLKLLEELGYGEFRSKINLSADGAMEDFVDFAIGVKELLPVNFTVA